MCINERLARIRESERKSHTEIYTNEKLYNTDSWLQRPIKTVREVSSFFDDYEELRVLDLGSGVGRNSIFIAEKFKNINVTVDCVDLLEIAIEKLLENAKDHNVASSINGFCKSIEEYEIRTSSYDLVMAISALEHLETEELLLKKLVEIKEGVREKGIVCFVINSNITETNPETKEPLETQFEINLSTKKMQYLINTVFGGWEVLKSSVVAQEYDIPRKLCTSRLKSDVVTFVARKCK